MGYESCVRAFQGKLTDVRDNPTATELLSLCTTSAPGKHQRDSRFFHINFHIKIQKVRN